MEGTIVLSLIFSVVILILFIKLCLNVSAIRRILGNKEYDDGIINYYKYYMMGQQHYHQAAEALTGALTAKILAEAKHSRKRMYEYLKQEHTVNFEKLGYPFPENVF